MDERVQAIREEIAGHASNRAFLEKGYQPLFEAGPKARIVVVGQAPGIRAQTAGLAWDDASGQRLMRWMGVDEATFRNPDLIANLPMDFYYPGKGKSGDLPPRRDFAALWHGGLLALMPEVRLMLLVGQYAQRHYLGKRRLPNLTQTVRGYASYLPDFFPIVHPSPLNFRWLAANPWFETELVPHLRQRVRAALAESADPPQKPLFSP